MLKITSVPTSPKILSRDGGILKATFIIILGCITFSVLTEFTFFFLSITEYLKFSKWLSYPIGFITTCFLIYLIEAKGIEFLKYVYDCILYKRIKEDAWLFFFSILITAVCYSASYFISISGVPSISNKLVEAPILGNTAAVDSTLNSERNFVLNNYSSDSLLVEQNYNNQISTLKNEYESKIEKENVSINHLDRKEQRTGKSFTTAKNRIRGKISDLDQTKENKVGQLLLQKNSELTDLRNGKNNRLSVIEADHRIGGSGIDSLNLNLQGVYESELESTKNGLGRGIFISIPLLFLCVFIQRRIYQKSGVEEQHQFDDYFYRESILSKGVNLLRVRWLSTVHVWLDGKFNKIKLDDYKPIVNKVFNRIDGTEYVDLTQLDASQMNLSSKNDGINATVKTSHSSQKNDGGKNRHTDTVRTITKTVRNDGEMKECKHCGTKFKPFPKHKKFCSDDCRKSNWEQKNNKSLMLKKKK